MPECRLDQISGPVFGSFVKQGFLVVKDFFEREISESLLRDLYKQFVILEMEGKFQIRRPRYAGQEMTRSDKFMDYSLVQLV